MFPAEDASGSAGSIGLFSSSCLLLYDYPDLSERELLMNAQVHNNDLSNVYTHKRFFKGFCYRSVRMIEDVDGAIVFNGRFGTLSEFTIAVEEGLNVAIIEGTGGITDEIKRLADVIYKQFPYNHVVFSKNYKDAIDQLMYNIANKK
jgi:predicted Rossmann-fold nucleotide-binding protein